jgi:adenylate cyclase
MNVLLRGSFVQQLRLYSGLVLFVFAASHFFNLALGLISLQAMEEFQTLRMAVTRNIVGTALLAGAFCIHMVLALVKLAERRTLQLARWEWVQLISGLIIPLLLIDHAFGMRFKAGLFGTDTFYKPSLVALWPGAALQQTVLLLLVWGHCCTGLHFWLRLASWYRRSAPVLLGMAVLLPALALAGFMVSGRELAASLKTAGDVKKVFDDANWPTAVQSAQLDHIVRWGLLVFGMLVAGVGAVLLSRTLGYQFAEKVAVAYTGGPTVDGRVGATLLEISRRNHVSHAAVCGGRARCSTCRVRIEAGASDLPAPQFAEAVTLGAIRAPEGVRLACQVRPTAAVTLTRLVSPQGVGPQRAVAKNSDEQGVERTLAVMFLDVRGFTRLSEKRLPYDVVFLLNRFFGALGDAIQSEGGWIDKYMGDGLLAVFGRETGTEAGCRSAIAAAARIDLALDRLNAELGTEVGEAIQVGIGLHVGPMVVGRIGHPETAAITVIGRTVNAGARLEAMTKELKCQLVVSKECAQLAGHDLSSLAPAQTVDVRGLTEPIEVFAVARGRELLQHAGATPKGKRLPATTASSV